MNETEPFIKSVYNMIMSKYNKDNYIIIWIENGQSFMLQNITQLKNLISKYLGTTDMGLFIQELREYGFYIKQGKYFSNPYFKKDCPWLLKKIKKNTKWINYNDTTHQNNLVRQIQILQVENYNFQQQKQELLDLLQEQIVQFDKITNNIRFDYEQAYKRLQYLQTCKNMYIQRYATDMNQQTNLGTVGPATSNFTLNNYNKHFVQQCYYYPQRQNNQQKDLNCVEESKLLKQYDDTEIKTETDDQNKNIRRCQSCNLL